MSFRARYQRGECVEVGAELVVLGDQVRCEPQVGDAAGMSEGSGY